MMMAITGPIAGDSQLILLFLSHQGYDIAYHADSAEQKELRTTNFVLV